MDEVPFHLLPPPELPHSLEAMGLEGLPSPELHSGAYLALRRRVEVRGLSSGLQVAFNFQDFGTEPDERVKLSPVETIETRSCLLVTYKLHMYNFCHVTRLNFLHTQ